MVNLKKLFSFFYFSGIVDRYKLIGEFMLVIKKVSK